MLTMDNQLIQCFFIIASTCFCLESAAVSTQDVSFALRTRQNPNNENFVTPLDINSVSSSKAVKIIVHGWTDTGNTTWILNMTKAFLKTGDYSVIAVDWQNPANKLYPISAKNTKDVGTIIGNLVVQLNKQKNISLSNFHLVGHSLGAHVMGFAGKHVKKVTGSKVKRITGLDAAGPLFEVPKQPPINRLSQLDGDIVEIVHSDGGLAGFLSPFGDIDFYPNGGLFIQPNCMNKTELSEIADGISCSHMRSAQYYTYAWPKGGIPAVKCTSWEKYDEGHCNKNFKAIFADNKPPTQKGIYFFKIVL